MFLRKIFSKNKKSDLEEVMAITEVKYVLKAKENSWRM